MEDDGNLSTFYDEIHLVLQCKSVSVDSLLSEMNQLREGHLLVKSVARASNDAAGDDAILAHKAFTQFADEVDDKLRGVQTSLDAMKTSVRVGVVVRQSGLVVVALSTNAGLVLDCLLYGGGNGDDAVGREYE